MNTAIANILKQKIEALTFVDTIAGLVEVAEKTHNKTQIRFPISRDVSHVDCINGRYTDLVPNDKKKSVIYFEDGGVQQVGQEGKRVQYSSTLLLVGWLNLKKIGVTDFDVTSKVIAALMKALECPRFNDGVFQRINISVQSQPPRDKIIFSKYTFRDEAKYLMFPFDYFSLRLSVDFELRADCLADFTLGTEDECLNC